MAADSIQSPIDRLIGVFAPVAALKRAQARARIMLTQRAYEGASKKDGWRVVRAGASANADHLSDATELRNRARALRANVPNIKGGIDKKVANLIGTGITAESKAASAADRKALNDAWAIFIKECDADGRIDFGGMQTLIEATRSTDGECLIRLRARRPQDGFRVPLQLQVLEIDWLDSNLNRLLPNNNAIISGIEYNVIGQVVNYWLWDRHPGDATLIRGARVQAKPVPASSIIHYFRPDRPGQGRGITDLAAVIATARDTQTLEDSELARKNLESRLSVLFSGEASDMAVPTGDASAAQASHTARQTGDMGQLGSGNIIELPSGGGNFSTVAMQAMPGHVDNVKWQNRKMATGMNITYEMLTGDMSEVNFSSARVSIIEFRRWAEQHQWHCIIPRLLESVWFAFVDACVIAGVTRRADYAVEWSTPKWEYVNPEVDVKADTEEINRGLSSVSEKLRKRGYKPAQVFAELANDIKILQANGVMDFIMLSQRGGRTFAEAEAAVKSLSVAPPNAGGA